MRHVFLLAILMLASLSQAQSSGRVELEAQSVAQEVRRAAPYLSVGQEQEILEHLRAVRQILYSGGNSNHGHDYDGGGYKSEARYTCVARDNDDRAPWVIGVRESVNVTRINTAQFSTKADCDTTLSTGRVIRGNNLICVARDNDGRAPWQLANIAGSTVTKIPATIVNTLENCQTFLRELRPRGVNAIFCGSRDNDSRAPYQAIIVNIETSQVTRGTELFDTVTKCNDFLNQ